MFSTRAHVLMAVPIAAAILLAAIKPASVAAACSSLSSSGSPRLDATGRQWRALCDPLHPAAPPRLEIFGGSGDTPGRTVCVKVGDRIVLGSGAAEWSLRLTATALESGAPGDHIHARISATGARVAATVVGPGAGLLLSSRLK